MNMGVILQNNQYVIKIEKGFGNGDLDMDKRLGMVQRLKRLGFGLCGQIWNKALDLVFNEKMVGNGLCGYGQSLEMVQMLKRLGNGVHSNMPLPHPKNANVYIIQWHVRSIPL